MFSILRFSISHKLYCFIANSLAKTVSAFLVLFLVALQGINTELSAQTFTRITIDNDATWARGVSWIDFDNDGDLDLYITNNDYSGVITFVAEKNRNKFFRNDGNDVFVPIIPEGMADDTSFTLGQTWADYDNDGNMDLYTANVNAIYETTLNTPTTLGSALYRNQGSPDYLFTRLASGEASSLNRIGGFAAAWGDYDNDGYVDLFITTPSTSFYPNEVQTNILFDNNGDGTFARSSTSPIVNVPADFYTIPSWSDYDLDGDLDLYITAGPIQNGVLQPDYFFKNMLKETDVATFERDTTSNFASEPRDAQQANWIDFDNDGDLDLYVTNFGGTPGINVGMANDLYRNDDGEYTKITSGAPVANRNVSFGQIWGDFDNDGDLDLYVTNFTSQFNFGGNDYYQNDGAPDYSFARIRTGDFVTGNRASWGAASGDYDNDGDLDLYVTINSLTAGPARDALYRNDANNGNNWINIQCVGTASNRAAIGAIVRVKATVFGNTFWQMREISSQNAANGHNSLRAHFGLGDATLIDSISVTWPSGMIDIATNVSPNAFMTATEGSQIVVSIDERVPFVGPESFLLHQNFPNPFNPSTTIRFSLQQREEVTLRVFDVVGREVATLVNDELPGGDHSVVFAAGELASGVYFYTLSAGQFIQTRKALLMK